MHSYLKDSTAYRLFTAVMMDSYHMLTPGAIMDFGFDTCDEDLFGHYQRIVKHHGVTVEQLHKVVCDGDLITELFKEHGIEYKVTTAYEVF